eukprot:11557929-Ditylum_brightwellii.AAC.1
MDMVTVATEKHKKYCNLKIAMKNQYKLCKIQTVSFVIDALGMMSHKFETNLAKVLPRACADTIQKQ